MTDLQTNQSFPFDRSYRKVIEQLHRWETNIISQLDQMYENVLLNMSEAFDEAHYFASITHGFLIEQEYQLKQARTTKEIDRIEEKIEQILIEVRFLQTLSFHINSNSVQLSGPLPINYNNYEINLTSSSTELLIHTNYRFLISRIDAIELDKHSLPIVHLTNHENPSINECVLTFNTSDLHTFLEVFDMFWNIFPKNNELRLLIPQYNISFIMGKLGETSRLLTKRFQLDQIRVFPNSCPKSDERILVLNGKRRELVRKCIEEIYSNIEERNQQNESIKQTIHFYNPASLSSDDVNQLMIMNVDYGQLIPMPIKKNHSRLQIMEEEESEEEIEEDDLWNENEDWWSIQPNNSEIIQREMVINNIYAGLIIGVNARRIVQLKEKTGAYVYVNGETSDPTRTVIVKGTHGQVHRAVSCIEHLITRYRNNKLPIKQLRSHGKRKGK